MGWDRMQIAARDPSLQLLRRFFSLRFFLKVIKKIVFEGGKKKKIKTQFLFYLNLWGFFLSSISAVSVLKLLLLFFFFLNLGCFSFLFSDKRFDLSMFKTQLHKNWNFSVWGLIRWRYWSKLGSFPFSNKKAAKFSCLFVPRWEFFSLFYLILISNVNWSDLSSIICLETD